MTKTGGSAATPILEHDDFIRDFVWAHLDDEAEVPAVEFVHHRHGILEYRFAGGQRVFAKPFDDVGKALAAYEIQRALWEGAFGQRSPYRVPQPLAFRPDEGVVLMGAAPGERVRELATGHRATWEDALRGSARWLAALHASPHRLGPPDDATRRVLHLARRVAETAAHRPDLERLLVRLLAELADRIPVRDGPAPLVQTHGRYHPQHVYVTSEVVTVIDADRATPGDAAKDVGEFLHRLRGDARSAGLDTEAADRASGVFVAEYARHSPADLSALEFYWSYSLLFTLVARGGRTDAADAEAAKRIEFYESEFATLPERVTSYLSATEGAP